MSQDLFAAFGSQEDIVNQTAAANQLGTGNAIFSALGNDETVSHSQSTVPTVDEEDDFGDFEDASATSPPPPAASGSGYPPPKATPGRSAPTSTMSSSREPVKAAPDLGSHPFAGNMDILFAADDEEYDAGQDEMDDIANNPEAAMAYSKRIIAEQQAAQQRSSTVSAAPPSKTAVNAYPHHSQPASSPKKLQKKSGHAATRDPNVLFDADDVSEHDRDDDDFGDFDGGNWSTGQKGATEPATRSQMPTAMPKIDLLGLDDSSTTAQHAAPNDVAAPTVESTPNDGWGDFEIPDSELSSQTTVPKTKPAAPIQRSSAPQSASPNQVTDVKALPPTNIPPPAVLLSIFPSIFSSAQDALFRPMAKLDLKQRQMLLGHPATHMFLKSYLTLGIVLGHIIAGRRLRWKRDQYLAQGMRIGPSAAGGKGGMKLAGIDRGEAAKEDREVIDAVTMWKGQLGRLRTAVTSASTAPKSSKLPPVPEIAETMPVKTLKAIEGGLTAPHACALCGLQREERVAKVDIEVDDSFGEWWLDGMSMHVACRNFWEEHKSKLKSR